MNKYILNPKYEYFKKDLLNIKLLFSNSDKSIHKARNELKIIEIDSVKYVIKSFKVPHIINRVAYTYFRKGKAKKSYLNAIKLLNLGINTPEPIGVIEFFNFNLLSESYFISLYEPYDFTIREVFHHNINEYKLILKEFAKFTYDIHKHGIWHEDYSLGNILITQKNTNYKFSLVDINRMKFQDIKGYNGLKNLNKFWAKDKEDLIYLATEYAKLAQLDATKSINIILSEAQKIERKKQLKKKFLKKS
jgi:hypothetical protein